MPNGSYRSPDGKRVTRNTPGAKRSVKISKKWYGRYTDGAGVQHRVPLSESREIARRMLAKLAGDAQLAGVGIADPFAAHRGRPLTEHLEEYGRYLAGKGDTAEHVIRMRRRVQAVLKECRFLVADDIQAAPVVDFLDSLRERGGRRELSPGKAWYTKTEMVAVLGIHSASVARMLSGAGLAGTGNGKARRYSREVVQALQDRLGRGAGVTTRNHYLTAVKGFTRWLAKDRRIAADPLSHLARQNADVDVRRPRRALREDLFARFIEATVRGGSFRGLTGADRLALYLLAANTGLRASELASLSPDSFDLDGRQPTVTVAAAYSKRRRKDVQPLRGDVAEVMGQYLAGRPKGKAVWPGSWHERAAEMIRADLAAAGIPYQDEAGRYFDFHALRGQFISFLAARGIHPKVAQALARHSTITLTMDYYTHLDVLDVAGALDRLPQLPGGQGADKAREKEKRRA
jgi:integrase